MLILNNTYVQPKHQLVFYLGYSRDITNEEVKTLLAKARQDHRSIGERPNSLLEHRSFSFPPYLFKQAHQYDLKVLEFPKYGSTKAHSIDHVMAFENKLLLHKFDGVDCDNLFYRLILGIFNGNALNWLAELSVGYISSWGEFRAMFASRFSHNCSIRKTMKSLSLL